MRALLKQYCSHYLTNSATPIAPICSQLRIFGITRARLSPALPDADIFAYNYTYKPITIVLLQHVLLGAVSWFLPY
jgi:hypothetical protein